jgi:hypothetical protein
MRPIDPVIPYWLTFEPNPLIDRLGLHVDCGVSGYTLDDAHRIVQEVVFGDEPMPEPIQVIENIKMSDLDQGHVVPNMLPMIWRGILYPMNFGGDPRKF